MDSDSKFKSENDVDSQLSLSLTSGLDSPGSENKLSIKFEGALGKEQMEEQIAQLRAENCQLQTRLFHIEQFVLPGKHRETEQLLQQIGKEKMVTAQAEQQRLYAIDQLQGNMTTLNSVMKEKEQLELQHKKLTKEVQVLKSELSTKTIQCENERRISMETGTGLTEEEHEKVKKENSDLRDLLGKSEQMVESLLAEKAAIMEKANKERTDLVGVNLSHQKEIHSLQAKVKRMKINKEKFLSTSHTVIEMLVATTHDLKIDGDKAAAQIQDGFDDGSCTEQLPATPRMETNSHSRTPLALDSTPSSSPGLNVGPEFHSADKSSDGKPRCICGKTFHNKQSLNNHILLYGECKRPFACAKCPKRYPARHTLRCHEKNAHNINHSKRRARRKREVNGLAGSYDQTTLNVSSNSNNMEELDDEMDCSESEEEFDAQN